jgi:GNAT superfamily N-acetyltransferase
MEPQIDHYEGIDGTPVVAIAVRGHAELLAAGAPEQFVALHYSYNGITASLDGKVVGVIVWIDQKDSRRIWLQLGYVLPEFRGQGIYNHVARSSREGQGIEAPFDLVRDRY